MSLTPKEPTTGETEGAHGYQMIWTPPEIVQPDVGYRFSSDAFLLASFARHLGGGHSWCDLGSGSGVVAYELAKSFGGKGFALERQPELVAYARRNLKDFPVTLVEGDLRTFPWRVDFLDLVVTNPPFFEVGAGKINQNKTIAQARHTFHGGVEAFADAVFHAVKPQGLFCFVFPQLLVDRPLKSLLKAGWYIRERLLVRPFAHRDPKLVCLALSKTPGEVREREIVQYQSHRLFTDEMQYFLRDGVLPCCD